MATAHSRHIPPWPGSPPRTDLKVLQSSRYTIRDTGCGTVFLTGLHRPCDLRRAASPQKLYQFPGFFADSAAIRDSEAASKNLVKPGHNLDCRCNSLYRLEPSYTHVR